MESKVYIISKIIWVLLDIETNFLRSRFTNRYCIAIERIVTVRKTEIKKKRISRFPKFLPLVIFVILFIPCTLSIFSFFLFFIFSPKPKEGNSKKIPTLEAQLQSDRAKVTLSSPVIFIRACVDPADC